MTPKWEEVAGKLKNVVKIAYVDTEGGPTPAAIGQIKGTPTIKAFVPKRSSARNEKSMVDYEQAREVSDFVRFATSQMPNYVERLDSSAALAKYTAKAAEWGLPRVLVVSDKAGSSTSSILKALSAEYRRRVLIGDFRVKVNPALAKQHGVTSYPTLLCLPAGAEEATHRFEGKEPTYRRLDSFMSKCALRKPVLKKPVASGKEEL
mmetsp:Transcript_52552/g.87193  ORF Transcript_52552/g.87193 Transcript_52552/m.87193 type:complete len:206 (+) Transcript_52552:219-836(+)|eukprot:CAMPEP_0119300584 /NCGR_PEP_ID=MMETSP1333-20130426/2516_1 /TAXON_ID=418940 /ORGANISM="Scyphosphaera apsteinii, Strain RCC1455" /LENGTH=205 /DNA_ID=CAMNT_0007302411 /DNA_START=215 /DNA_END=832 /DNA_ORIENTATION=+